MTNLHVTTLDWLDSPPAGTGATSPFRAPLKDTYELLMAELTAIGTTTALLTVGLIGHPRFRADGLPRIPARMSHRGVDLLIIARPGPLHYVGTKYATWGDNLRAIALGLKALRAVDRYGITPHYEQYRGWLELPAAPAGDQALRILAEIAGVQFDPDIAAIDIPLLYRRAVRNTHPDFGGSDADFLAVTQARRDLEAAGRWPASST